MSRYWIQNVVKRKGRVREYMLRKYGVRAFNRDGTMKKTYLVKAKQQVVKKTNNRSLISALNLAIRLKNMKKKKR